LISALTAFVLQVIKNLGRDNSINAFCQGYECSSRGEEKEKEANIDPSKKRGRRRDTAKEGRRTTRRARKDAWESDETRRVTLDPLQGPGGEGALKT